MTLGKITAWLAFAAALVLLAATSGCGADSEPAFAPAVFADSTAEADQTDLAALAAQARAEHEREQAAQTAAIEAVQQNGWQGWHPPYEPVF